jgi:predicted outer membrane repeat protein
MWFNFSRKTRSADRKRPTFRPTLEALEQRWVPSTLTVTSAANSGTGSLRAAIAAAQSNDTIAFAPSLAGQTITLKGELLLNKNLTIAGLGAGALTISGNHASRVFEVAAGMQVNLSGLTLSNGLAAAANGGGILVDAGAVLTLSNSTLSGNSASFNRKGIGGIGGGIDNSGTATLSGCILSDNTTQFPDGATGGTGGAIYNHATLTVNNNSAVSGNTTIGIENYGTATISGSAVSDNSGGGIYNFSVGTLTVNNNSVVSHNSADQGGGIFNLGTATISGSTLSDNSATEYGGGIYCGSNFSGSGRLNMSGCTLSGNSAQYGGGFYVTGGTVTLSASTLSGNTASFEGGGIFVYGGTLTLSASTLSGNSADHGGGIFASNGGTVTVENSSTISGNLAPVGYSADDVDNQGVLYLDSTSTIGIRDGNPAVPI